MTVTIGALVTRFASSSSVNSSSLAASGSRGSTVWTPDAPSCPSRRGGLRGPRRPRVPLLLLATGSSSDGVDHDRRGQLLVEPGRDAGREGPPAGTAVDGGGDTCGVVAAVSAPARGAAGG